MDWIENFNNAIRYIEDHLTGEIDYEQLGKIACCSSYHFQRMFAYMADVPLSEYIRRRRMSLAAVDLLQDERVLDVALKYGYNSPTAFNRAFHFPGSGTNRSIQELEQRIFTEWLPTSGYEYADAPDIEVYLNPDPENACFEVWVPVVKKKDASF